MINLYGLDTTFLIDLIQGDPAAKQLAVELSYQNLNTTQINVYELLLGFYSATGKDIGPDIERAQGLLDELTLLPITPNAAQRAAQIGGFLSRKRRKIEHMDCLIAGTLLAHGCTTLVTRNTEHFKRIPGLKVKTY